MYEHRTPPKITISEASSHHTASVPVGTPAVLRDVAIGVIAVGTPSSVRCGESAPQAGWFCGQKSSLRSGWLYSYGPR
jgi:hypothetical protein